MISMSFKAMAVAFGLSAMCLGASLPVPAAAADGTTATTKSKRGGRLSVCKADIDKLCSGKERHERWSCLESNQANLSSECKAALTRLREARLKVAEACKADTQALCAGETGRSTFGCLRKNEARLSPECTAALEGMPSRRKGGNDSKPTDGDIKN
jgi:hypothetical protein